jgi:hypothetical protein
MRNVADESCRENQNTCFMFSNFFSESCVIYENVQICHTARQATDMSYGQTGHRYVIRPDRPQMTMCVMWHIPFACWITKATDKCLICVIRIAFHGSNGFVNTPQR